MWGCESLTNGHQKHPKTSNHSRCCPKTTLRCDHLQWGYCWVVGPSRTVQRPYPSRQNNSAHIVEAWLLPVGEICYLGCVPLRPPPWSLEHHSEAQSIRVHASQRRSAAVHMVGRSWSEKVGRRGRRVMVRLTTVSPGMPSMPRWRQGTKRELWRSFGAALKRGEPGIRGRVGEQYYVLWRWRRWHCHRSAPLLRRETVLRCGGQGDGSNVQHWWQPYALQWGALAREIELTRRRWSGDSLCPCAEGAPQTRDWAPYQVRQRDLAGGDFPRQPVLPLNFNSSTRKSTVAYFINMPGISNILLYLV